ncbi:YceI family protein [Methylopila sp. M107]|uniref:YceI family protein n=1 Tax=Methylopila sp. M107 TaxID=1101190 RepID=UPI00035C2F65|nr:YceI family protein [Methylopila sp. M107]
MKRNLYALAAAALVATSGPAFAQDRSAATPAGMPGVSDVTRIKSGTYRTDPDHTQIAWSVDHMGFSTLFGMFGQIAGSLTLDAADPKAAELEIEIPMSGLVVTSEKFSKHLRSAEILDAEKFPTATFRSTSIEPLGQKARISGDLTVHGVTRPVRLDVAFHGAGVNPMTKAETIGFSATTRVKRSEFGLGYATPVVSDDVEVTIVAAFEKQP